MAIGIGATTAVFSIADAVLLRPSPYAAADRLVTIEQMTPRAPISVISADDYLSWGDRSDIFEKTVPYRRDILTLTQPEPPDQVFAVRTPAELFRLLGVHAAIGRTLTNSDDAPNGPNSAVISDRFWRGTFNADPNVIGKTIVASDEAFTIVGVMPPEFEFPYTQDELWIPLRLHPGSKGNLEVVGRLRAGLNIQQAQQAMQGVAQRLQQLDPPTKSGLRINVSRWQEALAPNYARSAVLILVAVGLVLLIACANVGGLLLSRAVQRQREIAIRRSLGARFRQLAAQQLSENLILAMIGTAAGLGIAKLILKLLVRQLAALPFALPHLQRVSLNARVLVFDAAVCLLVACICSLAPLAFTSQTSDDLLRTGPAGSSRTSVRLFSTLIASESAFAFLLLAGSALLIRSLLNLQNADTGFHAEHVLTVRVPIGTRAQPNPAGKYAAPAQQIEFYRQVLDRLTATPGVRAAALVNNLPLSEANTVTAYRGPDGALVSVMTRTISSQYFSVMGIPLLKGRPFADSDNASGPRVAIINDYLARLWFPDRNPIGEFLPGTGSVQVMVVGVVANSWRSKYDEPSAGELYLPYRQKIFGTFLSTIVVRTSGDPLAIAATVRKEIWAVDPNEPVLKVRTMDEIISESIWRPRVTAWIFGMLGALALLLTSAGVYGIVAYTSTLRAKEVGIRVAVGAEPLNVVALVLRGALIPLLAGLAAGLISASALARLVATILYHTSYTDPISYAGAALFLIVTGIAASLRPAWRAATADPLIALRAQ